MASAATLQLVSNSIITHNYDGKEPDTCSIEKTASNDD